MQLKSLELRRIKKLDKARRKDNSERTEKLIEEELKKKALEHLDTNDSWGFEVSRLQVGLLLNVLEARSFKQLYTYTQVDECIFEIRNRELFFDTESV